MQNGEKLEVKATLELQSHLELYRVVDFLNKNLKENGLIFGLSQKDETMTISMYEI